MEAIQLLGTAMGLGFVSGLNLYATVLAVGLGINLGLIQLSPHLAGLGVLGDPLVIAVAALMYGIEFFADKIPWVDSAWDAVHTFIRPLGAAWIGAAALGRVDPGLDVAAFLLAGGVALSSHSAKAGLRVVVNGSPEPFSNVALSLAEDVMAVGGAWLTLRYPAVAGVLAATFFLGFLLVAPRLLRLLRTHAQAVAALVRAWLGQERPADDLFDELPPSIAARLPADFGKPGDLALRCVAGRGLGARVGQLGYLCRASGALSWLGRQGVRVREYPIDLGRVGEIRARREPLFDRLLVRTGAHTVELCFMRDRRRTLDVLLRQLEAGAPPVAAPPMPTAV
jgi:hypothetical protein